MKITENQFRKCDIHGNFLNVIKPGEILGWELVSHKISKQLITRQCIYKSGKLVPRSRLKGALSQEFCCFELRSFVAEIFTWYLYSFPKCSNGLTETDQTNQWWLREQTIINFWAIFSRMMALEFEKTG